MALAYYRFFGIENIDIFFGVENIGVTSEVRILHALEVERKQWNVGGGVREEGVWRNAAPAYSSQD